MRTIAMIPARYAASRFPGKLMQDLAGKPVIVRTFEATKRTELFDDVFVVTDSEIIFETVEKYGGKAVMRPKCCCRGAWVASRISRPTSKAAFPPISSRAVAATWGLGRRW